MLPRWERTSDKFLLVTATVLLLVFWAGLLAYWILQNGKNYSKIVNYSGKVSVNVQRMAKFYASGEKNTVFLIAEEVKSYLRYLNKKANDLRIPLLDAEEDFRPIEVERCFNDLLAAASAGVAPEKVLKISEVCYRVCEETADFYQYLVSRNLNILETLFFTNAALLAGLVGYLVRINLKEVKGELEISATYDALTKTLNRQSFLKLFPKKAAKGEVHALILFDVDHFKSVNDEFGHAAGDRVLAQIAEAVKKILRREDVLARWGGEEFIVFLPRTDAEGAKVVAQKLRNAVRELQIPELRGRRITISLGVTTLRKGEQLKEAVKRADEALYRAKRLGRDRVEEA